MSDLLAQIEEIEGAALGQVQASADLDALRDLEVATLGRKGSLTSVLRGLKDLSPDDRRAAGQRSNDLKRKLQEAIDRRRAALEEAEVQASLEKDRLDPTQPGPPRAYGHPHPILAMQRELAQLFESMGFTVMDGPEVETEYYNFEALNIPSWHPARDMQDTFWLKGGGVLRTHTSGMQIRAMQERGAPLRVVALGRVFRNEDQDASHEHTFHQIEGLVVDEGISVAHLKGVLDAMLQGVFGEPVTSRLRPSYFPFVEPGLELDFECRICKGKGCPTCKGTGWVEMCGCGMVHPNVLKAGGIDSERYTGFAFGLGIDRLTMMRYAVPDIRLFMSGDLRFLEQFHTG